MRIKEKLRVEITKELQGPLMEKVEWYKNERERIEKEL